MSATDGRAVADLLYGRNKEGVRMTLDEALEVYQEAFKRWRDLKNKAEAANEEWQRAADLYRDRLREQENDRS